MQTPFFTIIVPVYNVAPYLRQCLDSILSQKDTSLQVIIVDDGSTDESPGICDEYAGETVTVLHKANGGLSDARNAARPYIRGRYVLYIDSDDFLLSPTFLHEAETALKEHEDVEVLIFGFQKYFEASGKWKKFPPHVSGDYLLSDFDALARRGLYLLSACGKIIRADLIQSGKLDFEKGVVSEDMLWCVELALLAEHYLVMHSAPYAYRQRAGSISHSVTERNINDIEGNLEKCLNRAESFPHKDALDIFLAQYYFMCFIETATLPMDALRRHIPFLKRHRNIIRRGVKTRERILNAMLTVFGVGFPLLLIRGFRKLRGR